MKPDIPASGHASVSEVTGIEERSLRQKLLTSQPFWVTVALLVLAVGIALYQPSFASSANLSNVTRNFDHGRVAFADWLAGMGLLVIVDHGEGFLTLYGYNETTLKSAGDWVAPGDVIATVGDSGGQAQTGLYFEIRQGTSPVNPRAWVSRQPKPN